MGEAFEALIGIPQGAGLASDIEPPAHGFATLLRRRAGARDEAADRLGLAEAPDGSEVAEPGPEATSAPSTRC